LLQCGNAEGARSLRSGVAFCAAAAVAPSRKSGGAVPAFPDAGRRRRAENGFAVSGTPPRSARAFEGAPGPEEPDAKEHAMKWETPAAIDYRFGFEITLYIANR
jgi:coenzyme PQQ precursor peptide PqqA